MTSQTPASQKAMVFICVDPRIESMVIDEIRTYEGVKEAHYIYGPYDMYVEIEAPSDDFIQDLVLNKIRNLYGILETTTCYLAE
jgi:DNA-binding Lrp family transcriptional regulator